jgi:hypothetical protein
MGAWGNGCFDARIHANAYRVQDLSNHPAPQQEVWWWLGADPRHTPAVHDLQRRHEQAEARLWRMRDVPLA